MADRVRSERHPRESVLGKIFVFGLFVAALLGVVSMTHFRSPSGKGDGAEGTKNESASASRAEATKRHELPRFASAEETPAPEPLGTPAPGTPGRRASTRPRHTSAAVATYAPLLAGASIEKQIELLKWAKTLPEGKLVSMFPSVNAALDLPKDVRLRLANEIADQLLSIAEDQQAEHKNEVVR